MRGCVRRSTWAKVVMEGEACSAVGFGVGSLPADLSPAQAWDVLPPSLWVTTADQAKEGGAGWCGDLWGSARSPQGQTRGLPAERVVNNKPLLEHAAQNF